METMKIVIKTILATSVIFTTFCVPDSYSQIRLLEQEEEQPRNSCDAVLKNVESRIKNNSYMTLRFEGRQISESWRQGSRGRSIRLMVILGKSGEGSYQRVSNVLSSPRMLTDMSKQLIEICNNVAAVSYGQNQTGFTRTFGSIGGVVREFEYVESDRRSPDNLRWGLDWSL